MVFINFKMRMEIESLFIEWCEKNRIAKKPNSMVVFMIENGWLNEEKINKDLYDKALEYYESKRKTEPIKTVMPKAHGRKQALLMIDEIMTLADRKPNSSEKPNNSKVSEKPTGSERSSE